MAISNKKSAVSATGGNASPVDEERLAAMLASPFVDKILAENEQEKLATRQRHADEITRIEAELLHKLPEHDGRLAKILGEIDLAEKRLAELRDSYRAADYQKSLFFNQAIHAKKMHENELNISAPLVDEFVSEIMDLWERNQHVSATETVLSSKIDMTGQTRKVTFETDGPTANSWHIQVSNVLAAARAMKLDWDFRTYPERLAKLRESIADPHNFKRITISKEIELQPKNSKTSDAKGR